MKLNINSELVELENISSLKDVLLTLSVPSLDGIAIAVNDEVIPKKAWEAHVVSENDSILIITATQGG